MNKQKMAKLVKRVGVMVGKEARKAGFEPLRYDGAFLDDGTLMFFVDMADKRKDLH